MAFIRIKKTKNTGLGVYALRNFCIGDRVLKFQGKIVYERGDHTLQIGRDEHILVKEPEKYVNHSCDPNCGIKNKNILVAIKPIKIGEEITFDYAMTEYEISGTGMHCLCGEDKVCRKIIMGYKDVSFNWEKKYEKFTSSYLKNKKLN